MYMPPILAGTLHQLVVLKYLPELLRYLSKMCLDTVDSECWDITRIEWNIQFEMFFLKKY